MWKKLFKKKPDRMISYREFTNKFTNQTWAWSKWKSGTERVEPIESFVKNFTRRMK